MDFYLFIYFSNLKFPEQENVEKIKRKEQKRKGNGREEKKRKEKINAREESKGDQRSGSVQNSPASTPLIKTKEKARFGSISGRDTNTLSPESPNSSLSERFLHYIGIIFKWVSLIFIQFKWVCLKVEHELESVID